MVRQLQRGLWGATGRGGGGGKVVWLEKRGEWEDGGHVKERGDDKDA